MNRIQAATLFVGHGQTVRLRAFGHSMTPAIRSGDRLIVEPAALEELVKGDVVLARAGGHLIAHRVACLLPGGRFLLRDDQTGCDDGWFSAESLVGRVAAVEREGVRRPVAYRPLALFVRRQAALVRAALRPSVFK